jgi:hypothetical protein
VTPPDPANRLHRQHPPTTRSCCWPSRR